MRKSLLALVAILILGFVLWPGKEKKARVPAPAEAHKKLTRPPSERAAQAPNERPGRATLKLPDYKGTLYVNGKPAKGEVEVDAGEVVITAWDGESYAHEVLRVDEGDSAPVRLERKTEEPARDWTTFQGDPLRRGHVRARDRETLEEAWRLELGQGVQSSPVILDGIAYFSAANSALVAIDLAQGKLLWQRAGRGTALAPTTTNRFMFAASSDALFQGYSLPEGTLQGEAELAAEADFIAASAGGALLVGSADRLINFKTRKTFAGALPLKQAWAAALDPGPSATPLIFQDRFVVNTRLGLSAYALDTGELLWPLPEEVNGKPQPRKGKAVNGAANGFLLPTPASDGAVIYATVAGGIGATALDGTPLWQTPIRAEVTSSLALAHGQLYFATRSGELYIMSVRDPDNAVIVPLGKGPVYASPVLFADKLLTCAPDGTVALRNAFSGELLAENNALAGTTIYATPAVTDDAILVIAGNGHLVCFR